MGIEQKLTNSCARPWGKKTSQMPYVGNFGFPLVFAQDTFTGDVGKEFDHYLTNVYTCVFRFLPGVLPDPPVSASPGKRRSQSLSALPKDDKNSPGKVCYTYTQTEHTPVQKINFRHTETIVFFTLCLFCCYSFNHRGRRITSGGP